MADRPIDVVGVGNAIVDVLAQAEDAFLTEQNLAKGAMTLIDGGRAEELYDLMGPGVEVSGGSAANTLAGLASLGGRGAFIGKVRDDQLGGIFRHDIRASGVRFDTPAASEGPPTARCLIFVTPDAQRTMNTFLGVSVELGPGDLDAGVIQDARVTYLEGYLWDAPAAKEAFLDACRMAHEAGNRVALTLSDAFCVERHRDSFIELISGHVDLLFANEAEICSLFQVDSFDRALQMTRDHCEVTALTRSEKGSVIVSDNEVHVVDAEPVKQVVDTTGAGDLYAAGFLHGFTQGRNLYDCGRIGAIAAGEAIAHFGARPEAPLDELVAARLGAA
jgi:sugar/nucleoside kinase (ribokinase family)